MNFKSKDVDFPSARKNISNKLVPLDHFDRKRTQSTHFLEQPLAKDQSSISILQKLEKIKDDSEALENFDEYIVNDVNPSEYLKNGSKNGFSRFVLLDGDLQWRECEILSYNEITKKYAIRFFNTQIRKEVKIV